MIEVIVKCMRCESEFTQQAHTEDEIKALQRNIWAKGMCAVCERASTEYWGDCE